MTIDFDPTVAYCVNGCGQLAIGERFHGITNTGEEIVELICDLCANEGAA